MTRRHLTAGHIFVTKYVLISAPVSIIFKSGRKPDTKESEVKLMENFTRVQFTPVFNLMVLRTNDGYLVIYNDNTFHADDEQSVLNLIRNFADARFEW